MRMSIKSGGSLLHEVYVVDAYIGQDQFVTYMTLYCIIRLLHMTLYCIIYTGGLLSWQFTILATIQAFFLNFQAFFRNSKHLSKFQAFFQKFQAFLHKIQAFFQKSKSFFAKIVNHQDSDPTT